MRLALSAEHIAAWLQLLIQRRIQTDLRLHFDYAASMWRLTCPGAARSITFEIIPAFYQVGTSTELPCGLFEVAREGLDGIEPSLMTPAPGLVGPRERLTERTGGGLHLCYDIPGLAYWMLTRCEEVSPPIALLDGHGRFPATASHAFRHGYLERPIVDEWLGILRQIIRRLWPSLPLVEPRFQVVVSHDVDAPSAYAFGRNRSLVRAMATEFFRRRDPRIALSAPWIRLRTRHQLHPRDPFNTFDWLMDTSDAAGVRSAFYFICGRTDPRLDANYEPEHPAIRSLMRRIHHRGHEIGLHPSYRTCAHPERIVREAQRLRRICDEERIQQSHWGGRMHFLRWLWPTTAHGWEQADFDYDSTLGYADRPGFRCGTCHAYQMFDPVAQRPLRLTQRPLIAMECSVIAPRYLGLGYGPASLALFQRLKHRCKAVGGQFTLLWHNSHLTSKADRELYQKLVSL